MVSIPKTKKLVSIFSSLFFGVRLGCGGLVVAEVWKETKAAYFGCLYILVFIGCGLLGTRVSAVL